MKKSLFALLLAGILVVMSGCAIVVAETEPTSITTATTAAAQQEETTTVAAVTAAPAATVTQGTDAPADPTINVDNQAYWREIIQKYRKDEKVNQLMLVRYTGGCTATVCFYQKLADENNAWTLVFEEEDAVVGKYGIDKTKEGDAKTPTGDFGITQAFGIRKNPGTGLNYLNITETVYACDESCKYYNQIIDTAAVGHSCTGEAMFEYSPEYNYGLALDYNPSNADGLGSAIFLHCKGPKAFTGGCVALDEEHMVTVLQLADEGMRVVIGNN